MCINTLLKKIVMLSVHFRKIKIRNSDQQKRNKNKLENEFDGGQRNDVCIDV